MWRNLQYPNYQVLNKENAFQELQWGLRIDPDSSICMHRVFGITYLYTFTYWSCLCHLKLLKTLMSKFSQHCGEGRHTKNNVYISLVWISQLLCNLGLKIGIYILINKFYKHLYGKILDKRQIPPLGIVLKPYTYFLGKVNLERLGHLWDKLNFLSFHYITILFISINNVI